MSKFIQVYRKVQLHTPEGVQEGSEFVEYSVEEKLDMLKAELDDLVQRYNAHQVGHP